MTLKKPQRRKLSRKTSARKSDRRLSHETLERRELLAAGLGIDEGPRLISVSANSGEQFDLEDNNLLPVAPTELTFRFGGDLIDAATLAGIQFRRSGGDGSFNEGNEIDVNPGFLGFEQDNGTNIIVARFAETLPDDQYVVDIAGFDDTNAGIVGLRDINGNLICPPNPIDSLRPTQQVRFDLEVGPRVVGVVPQPVEIVNGNRIQRRDQVWVFFNEDPLSNPAAGAISSSNGATLPVVNPQFYKLIFTGDTVESTDDPVPFLPTDVTYDPALNRAVLTFSSDLSELAPVSAVGSTGTFRLRIGSGDALPLPPQIRPSGGGSEDTFAQALPLGVTFGGGTQSVVVTDGVIESPKAFVSQWPGASDAVGLREQRRDTEITGSIDTNIGINVFPYNFASLVGRDPQLNLVENAITEAQRQRAREVLDLYSERLGVTFVETENEGLQIVTGDLRALVISADTGAGSDTALSNYRVNESDPTQGVLILDAGENWYDGYGLSPDSRPSWFVEAVRGIGSLLGIGNLFHLPAGVAAGGSSPDEPNSVLFSEQFYPDLPLEPDFISQSDLTIGQALHRPESNDVDFYRFSATTSGFLSAETIAERLDGSSLLNTHLNLYLVENGEFTLIARNDDFYSDDSFIGLDIEAGDYIIGVSASGNENYNGEVSGSGLGGTSDGRYEMRITFAGSTGTTITDTTGTELDGDADGNEGGDFNFWFRTARDLSTAGAGQPRTIFVDKLGDDLNNGSLGTPLRTISAAFAIAEPGDIVRLLPNGGADGLITTTNDNLAYEIGLGGNGNQPLSDGAEFEVPRGVTVMIDAGAILKLQATKISVGSESVDEDRSLAALQVLGTPVLSEANGSAIGSGEVIFTSYNNEAFAVDTNPLATTPLPGNWAGIEFRNDFDYSEGRAVWETEGIFLDYVSHANMSYGGGSIAVNEPVVTPIHLAESRPTLIYNTITNSADAAISADPNSFLETNFHAPSFQRAASFTSDYQRVGPEISGNTLTDNSINGLFVRVNTPAAGQLEPMTVSGRFDDTDIVHALSQVLVLQGQPGGPLLMEERPDVLSVTLTAGMNGTLVADTYDYRLTFVDAVGNESLASLPTVQTTVANGGAITLDGLPSAPPEFAGRRLYRSNVFGDYEFVTQLDRGRSSFLDDGTTRGGVLRSEQVPNVSTIFFQSSLDVGSLFPGNAINYRMTFVDSVGGESQASVPTSSFITPASGSIRLNNVPSAPTGYVATRIYRLNVGSGDYELVSEVEIGETTYLDNGSQIGGLLTNNGNNSAILLPRLNARLSIDPGTIVKLQNSRIEAGFGSDFYAEGVDGREIVFTSRLDDTFGAGGTFDTNNDGVTDNAAPADWGGLIFRQDSIGSLDYTDVRFGGGSTPTQGDFTDFNAIEILQAEVRITNSTIHDNAAGSVDTSTRGGFGFNDDAAIFVRGSQPIIVDNIIEANAGAAISINPNALDFNDLLDVGRSTGPLDAIVTDQDNQGPLISGNRIDGNTINAMRVRSELLTTESVWDDTDIVHYVDGQIVSATHHYKGGLRLKSDPEQSLVVKHDRGAELVGAGIPLDNDDRIGGTLQVLGTPGNPVILTSINDCEVGAGFTPDGRPMNDTLLGGSCMVEEIIEPPTVPYVDVVVVMDESGSMGSTQAFSTQFITDLEAGLLAAGVGVVDGNRFGAVGFGNGRSGGENDGRSLIVGGGLFGTASDYVAAATSQFVTTGASEDGYAGIDFAIANYPFRADAAKFIILATDEPRSNNVRTLDLNNTIANLQANDILLQGILGMTIVDNNGQSALAIDNTDVYVETPGTATGFTTSPGGIITGGRSVQDYLPLVQATGGIAGDLSQIARSTQTAATFGQALISSIVVQAGGGGNNGAGVQGDWQGLTIDAFANDRNVAHIIETEDAIPAANARNAIADDSQRVGDLAAHEYAGDETERLGFNIRGTLADKTDVDVYSFTATGGTTVFLDIDDTSIGLDTTIELIDVNDAVLASSDNSFAEATDPTTLVSNLPDNVVRPLFLTGAGNTEGPNPLDAGMRVILPGSSNSENVYYVRVRSTNGITAGQYSLSIRLREADEVAGSTVQFADIRFATNAIQILGAPLRSPLTADAQESLNFSTIIDPTPANPQSGDEFVQETANNRLGFNNGDADRLGNLLTTDRGSLLVTGEIGNINTTNVDVRLEDIDVFQVDVFTQQIEPDVFDSENRFVPVTFDVDYADGLGRVNTSISVYNSFGQLILHSRDSNIADDVGRPLRGVDSENLAAGSASVLDAHIGPVELPEGTYFVAVGNATTIPSSLDQFFNPGSATPNTRLVPINSVRRIADDSLFDYDIASYDSDSPFNSFAAFSNTTNYAAESPIIEPAFDQNSIVPYTLDDIRLFVSLDTGISGNNRSSIASFNPFTGTMERLIGQSGQPTDDIALRRDGELYSYSLGPTTGAENSGNVGNFLNISPVNGAAANDGDDGVTFQQNNQMGTDLENSDGAQLDIHAITFPLSDGRATVNANSPAYVIGSRDNFGRFGEVPSELTRNIFYQTRAVGGAITSLGSTNANTHRMFNGTVPYFPDQGPASPDREHGIVDTGFIYDTGADAGDITGVGIDPENSSNFFAVTDNGGVHSFNPFSTVPAPDTSVAFGYDSVIPTVFHGVVEMDPIHAQSSFFNTAPNFTGMAMGPRTIENELYRQTIFAVTDDGWLYAIDINENSEVEPANVFYNGRAAIPLVFQSGTGIAVQPHGLAFSHLEESPWHQTNDRNSNDGQGIVQPYDQSRVNTFGGSTLYYGFEISGNPAENTIGSPDNNGGDIAPGGSHGSVISRPFNLEGYSAADKPTLYFSYFIEVEDDDDHDGAGRAQNDSFRVFGSGDDGEWQLLATNDAYRNLGDDDEFDYFDAQNIPVQELFDDNPDWRQARVDIGPLAGSENVRIRFDFSTAGSMRPHFGSVDFVAVPGDEIVDRQQISFQDNSFNTALFENIVGRDIVFPDGSALDNFDQFLVTGPDGQFAVRFVTGTPTSAGDVVFNAGMSALEVAEAVLQVLPASLNPIGNGDGSISLLAATDVTVVGDIPVGQSNPVAIEVVQRDATFFPVFNPASNGADQLIIPSGSELAAGEIVTITGPTSNLTLTYVNIPTGAPGEVPFSTADSSDDIARRVMALLPADFAAVYEGDGMINFVNDVTISLQASVSNILIDNTRLVAENRIRITPPALADNLIDGERLIITSTAGVSIITFVDEAGPSGPGLVRYQDGDTQTDLSDRLMQALPDSVLALRQGNDIQVIAASVITDVAGTDIVFGQLLSQLVSLPDGSGLIDGEVIRINSANGVQDITFINSTVAGPAGTINYVAGDSSASLEARLATAVGLPFLSTPGGVILYGATDAIPLSSTSNITTTFVNGQQVTVPDGTLMVDGETIDITANGSTTSFTFVETAGAPAAGQIAYQTTDSADVIAGRLLAALDPALSPLSSGSTVFFTADMVAHQLGMSQIDVASNLFTANMVNLVIPDAVDLHNGEQIQVFGFGPAETITFILQGTTVTDPGTIPVFYNPTDVAADLYDQIVDGLRVNFQAYVDPSGGGINIFDQTNSTIAFLGTSPIETTVSSTDINEFAIPITIPNGAEIVSGETLVITQKNDLSGFNTTTFTLTDVNFPTLAPNELTYDPSATADAVAQDLLSQLPIELQGFLVGTREIYLLNASSVATLPGSALVSHESALGAMPILVDSTMTSQEVAARLATAFAEGLGRLATSDGSSAAAPEDYKIYGTDRIRLYNATPVTTGAYGQSQYSIISGAAFTTTALPGDEFGEDQPFAIAGSQITTNGALNNEVEGVYIDDIIVGFAERGEMVLNAPVNNTNFVFNPETLPDTHPAAIQPERQNETVVGGYSLEIRTSDEYGVPQDYDPINLELDEQVGLGRSFDTNDRLSDSAVTLIVPAPSTLIDGDTFTLDDGDRLMTFEFDNVLDGNVTPGNVRVSYDTVHSDAAFIARAVRNAINSSQVQSVLDITAATSDSAESAFPTGNRVELFGDAISLNHSGGRFLKVDLVAAETYQGRETSKQFPSVDHTTDSVVYGNAGDELPRSTVTGFVNGNVDTLVGIGKIGDVVNTGTGVVNLQDGAVVLDDTPAFDFDSVRIFLQQGHSIDIDVDTAGFTKAAVVLDLPVITVVPQGRFGASEISGVTTDVRQEDILAQSSLFTPSSAPGEAEAGAFLQFTAPTTGYYDVVVSSNAIFGGIGGSGDYQLTIRPNAAASPAVPDRDVLMVDYQFGTGDVNRVSPQGQIIISSNFISDAAVSGILATSKPRGATLVSNGGALTNDDLPRPGSPALLRNQNSDGIIPGVVISNNVVTAAGNGAIVFEGDTSANGDVVASTLFGRILNNTVVGQGVGDGIRVGGSASPTILNNVIAFFDRGIATTASQTGEVIVGSNAYQNNETDSTLAISTSSVIVPQEIDLFEDPARRVYIPAAGSNVIDSSFASLPDRADFFQTVKEPAGISPSPIIAPSFDAYGQARVDDPLVATPGGVGLNVFIDRGAIDRADDERPIAVLTGPQDAIGFAVAGGDQDVDQSFVRLNEGIVEFFDVQLIDTAGTGLDPLTINSRNVILTENGRQLIPGTDYIFGYSTNSRTIRLTPLTGLWRSDSVYEITLNNKPRVEVTLPAGDQILDGEQIITIEEDGTRTTFEFDSGFSLVVPETTTLTFSGTNANLTDEEIITITSPSGVTRTLEIDLDNFVTPGNTNIIVDASSAGTVLSVRDTILAALNSVDAVDTSMTVAQVLELSPVAVDSNKIQLGTLTGHVVTSNLASVEITGVDSALADGQSFTYTTPTETVTFELTEDALVSDPTFIPVPISRTDTPDQIAQTIASTMAAQSLGLGSAQPIGNGTVLIGGIPGDTLTVDQSALQLLGSPGVSDDTFAVPFLPTPQFTSALTATALQAAIRNSTAGVNVFSPGAGTLLISGSQLVQATFGGSVPSSIGQLLPAVSDLAGNPVRETRITDETRFTIIMPDVVFDYSDAPQSYGTLDADNGARHTVADERLPRLGTYLDTETDGKPFPASDDAPLNLTVTETGVLFNILNPGASTSSIVVGTNQPQGGETLTLNVDGVSTTFELTLATSNPGAGNVPVSYVVGDTPENIATNLSLAIRGRVPQIDESIIMTLDTSNASISLEAIDDEDGISVGTFVNNGVPFHVFTTPGTPATNVTGSDVIGFLNPLDPAGSAMAVTVAGSGLLDAWVDFDQNGAFELDEQVVANAAVVNGVNIVNFFAPANVVQGDTWMRVRVSESGNLTPTGVSVGGEVEDFEISVLPIALPTPINDQYTATEDTLMVVDAVSTQPNLLQNDQDLVSQILPVRYFVGDEPANGTLTVLDELTGEFTYLPDPDFYGTDTFTYRLSTQQNSGPSTAIATFATVTINVQPVNDVPGAEDKSFVSTEDTTLVITAAELLAGATGHASPAIATPPQDESDQALRVSSVTANGFSIGSSNSTATITTNEGATVSAVFDAQGFISEVHYTPATDFNSDNLPLANGDERLDGFTYTVVDDGILVLDDASTIAGPTQSATALISIRVTPVNDVPALLPEVIGQNDAQYQAFYAGLGTPAPVPTEDTAIVIPGAFLLSNDNSGPASAADEVTFVRNNDGPLRIVGVSMVDPTDGTVTLLPNGDVSFVPADDVYGLVEFVYEVEDAGVDEATDGTRTSTPLRTSVTSSVFLEPINDLPVAYDRVLRVDETREPAAPNVLSFTSLDLLNGSGSSTTSAISVIGTSINVPDGTSIFDGETIIVTGADGLLRTIEFNTSGVASIGTDVLVTYTTTETSDEIATTLESQLRSSGLGGTAVGNTVSFLEISSVATSTYSTPVIANSSSVTVPDGASLTGGEVLTVTDANGNVVTLEFSKTGASINGADALIPYTSIDTSLDVANSLLAALASNGFGSTIVPGLTNDHIVQFVNIQGIVINEPATQIVRTNNVLTLPDGANIINGETVTIDDGAGNARVIEFNTTGSPSAGSDFVVIVTATDSAALVASSLETVLQAQGYGVTATGNDVEFNVVSAAAATPPITNVTASSSAIEVPNGSGLVDGELISITLDNGTTQVVEFNTSGTQNAGVDFVVPFNAADSASIIASRLETALRSAGYSADANGGTVDLVNITNVFVGEEVDAAGDFPATLPTPFSESEQSLRVVAFATPLGSVDFAVDGNGTHTLATTEGGLLTFTFVGGAFSTGTYEPAVDYNGLPPFNATDLFTYTIEDNGATTIPSTGLVQNLPDERSLTPATVTISVNPTNDSPTFDTPTEIDILEDSFGETVDNVIQNVLPSMASALDEVANQTVSFSLDMNLSIVPTGLMLQAPTIDANGGLTFFPAPDAVGSAIYVIRGTDADPNNPLHVAESTDATVTVNVRPVNDAPRFVSSLVNTGDINTDDDQYKIDAVFDANGVITSAPITYTLREDNSQPIGVTPAPYFIPLYQDPTIVGYNPVGLLDVFAAGPANELDATEGGNQVLTILTPSPTTRFGGSVTPVSNNGVIEGFLYQPPLDFNNEIGFEFDEFTYTVQDDSIAGGETFSLVTGVLERDFLQTSNVVRFDLNPVNDKPEFDLQANSREFPEDSNQVTIQNFAFNIAAGPAGTAFDEVDVINGQSVRFSMALIGTPASTAAQFFTEFPEISPNGTMTFQAAPDVYGDFVFEIFLTDDGAGNATRGDIISSDPQTFTLSIRPVNDPPIVNPNAAPLSYTLTENSSIDILVSGDTVTQGLLDVFFPGPTNESQNIDPGGNQTVSMATPIVTSTVQGGSLTQVFDPNSGELTHLRYTPRADFVGADSFIYTVTDDGETVGIGDGGNATNDPRFGSHNVSLLVTPVNDEPLFSGAGNVVSNEDDGPIVAVDWATNVLAGPATAGDELANQGLTFVITQVDGQTNLFSTPPTATVSTLTNTATLNYQSAPDRNGTATFEVFLLDNGPSSGNGDDNQSATQTFTIRVNAVNDPPSFTPGGNIQLQEDNGPFSEQWATNVSPGPNDEQSQSVRFEVDTPADSVALFQALPEISDSGVLRFTPASNANGTVNLTVRAIDSDGGETSEITFQIIIDEVNDAPVAVSDTIDTNEDIVLTIPSSRLILNDDDADLATNPNEVLRVNMSPEQFSVQGARVTFDATTGDVVYDPTNAVNIQSLAVGEPLIDSFSYTLVDAAGISSNPVTVSMKVIGSNDAPSLNIDRPTLSVDGTTIIRPLDNDTDIDTPRNSGVQLITTGTNTFRAIVPDGFFIANGETIDIVGVGGFSRTLTFVNTTGQPAANQIAFQSSDLANDIAQRLNAALSGLSPTIAGDGDTVEFTAVSAATDVPTPQGAEIDPTTISITLQPAFGSVAVSPDGVITYTPFGAFSTEDQFRYTVADDLGLRSDEGIVTIAANSAPIAIDDLALTFVGEAVDINVSANDFDPDGTLDLANIVILDAPGRGDAIPQSNGTVRYVPGSDFIGVDRFSYAIADTEGRFSEAASVQVNVSASRLQNPDRFSDVNDDGNLSPLDVLLVINRLSAAGVGSIPVTQADQGPFYYDVNGDQKITPRDALIVINELAARARNGSLGEQITTEDAAVTTSFSAREEALSVSSLETKIVDAALQDSVGGDVLDLISGDHNGEEDDDRIHAIDAAFDDLI